MPALTGFEKLFIRVHLWLKNVRVFGVVRGSPHPACGHVDSFASLLIRPAAFADSKFLSPFPKRLKSPHNINPSPGLWPPSPIRWAGEYILRDVFPA